MPIKQRSANIYNLIVSLTPLQEQVGLLCGLAVFLSVPDEKSLECEAKSNLYIYSPCTYTN